MESIEMINIASMPIGSVIKFYLDNEQKLANGVILKLENNKVMILSLNKDKPMVSITIKDCILEDIEFSTTVDRKYLITLHKAIREMYVRIQNMKGMA
ncbi:hypothetical protein FDF26_13940 [Clostridium botulinum]|uniref:hypothetical protein n=1 Tax=Clostridium sp. ZBS18 TaxID=2949967 RepID=UPI0013FC3AB1|nr:hypothetical protein [Clostridium sp. ZBS18]NFT08145.1 hypothetical protein [Clostridium botulinum]